MIKKIYLSPIFNSWFSSLVILLSSVVAIPIVITELSVAEANVWFLFFAIVSFGQGVIFSFNSVFLRFVSYSFSGVSVNEFRLIRHKSDTGFSNKISDAEFQSIVRLMGFIYLILAVLFFFFLFFVGYWGLSKPINEMESPADGWIAWAVVLTTTTIILYLSFIKVFLEGIHQVALVQRVLGLINLFGFIVILIVLLVYPTLVTIVFVYQLVALVAAVCLSVIGSVHLKKSHSINIFFPQYDRNLFGLVWESAWKSGLTSIVASSIKHLSALFVAQWFGPSQSASYQFTKRLFDVLESFTMTTFQARAPQIASLRGRGDIKSLIPFLKQTEWIAYGVFLSGYAVLLLFGNQILKMIGSNVELGSFELILLFSMATFLARWGGMTLSISNLSNYVVEHINALIVGIVFSVTVYFTKDILGVNAFPLSLIVALLVSAPAIVYQVYPTIKTTFWAYEKMVMLPALLILTTINLVYFLR